MSTILRETVRKRATKELLCQFFLVLFRRIVPERASSLQLLSAKRNKLLFHTIVELGLLHREKERYLDARVRKKRLPCDGGREKGV